MPTVSGGIEKMGVMGRSPRKCLGSYPLSSREKPALNIITSVSNWNIWGRKFTNYHDCPLQFAKGASWEKKIENQLVLDINSALAMNTINTSISPLRAYLF